MKHVLRSLLLLLFVLSQSAWATVNAWLDQDRIGPGDTVQLTLQHDGNTSGQPNLAPLRADFDILGRSSGSSIQIVNGKMTSKTQLTLVLSPKRSGKLTVPSLTWDGETTPVLALTVAAGSGGGTAPQGASSPTGVGGHVFLNTALDQKQPYVQAAATLTVRLYTDQPLYQASLDLPSNSDVLVQPLGQDSQSSVVKDGHTYKVIERKYLLIPQRSGRIRLDGPILNAEIQAGQGANPFGNDPFFGRIFGGNPFGGMVGGVKPVRVRADPVVLDVRPRPPGVGGQDWLPARQVTLEESWQPDNGPVHVGDPVTRHLHLSALGLTASQLPDLSQIMTLPPGLRAYPDQAKLDNGAQGDSVLGTRDQDIAVIASRAGDYNLPAMRLTWWDTTRNQRRELVLPARTLVVLPATTAYTTSTTPAGPAAGAPPDNATEPKAMVNEAQGEASLWPWISLVLGLLWMGTVVGWLWSRRAQTKKASPQTEHALDRNDEGHSPRAARQAFLAACRQSDALAARRSLIDWASSVWPHDPPLGLKTLAERLGDTALVPLLAALDRACYAGEPWDGANLATRLDRLRTTPRRDRQSGPLPSGLYV